MNERESLPPDRLDTMLHAQRLLQEESFGVVFDGQSDTVRIAQFKENVLALTNELHEALGEMSWKSWQTGVYLNRDAVKKELVDAWHFFMNLMLHVGMTPDELFIGYTRKRAVNAQRQAVGYDGVSTKCGECRRALEDVGLDVVAAFDEEPTCSAYICGGCGAAVSSETAKLLVGTIDQNR